jgi:hypothetical protein
LSFKSLDPHSPAEWPICPSSRTVTQLICRRTHSSSMITRDSSNSFGKRVINQASIKNQCLSRCNSRVQNLTYTPTTHVTTISKRIKTTNFSNKEGQVPVFIYPRKRAAQLYPQALGSVFVASYDYQSYGRIIRTHRQAGISGVSERVRLTFRLSVYQSVRLETHFK